MSTPHAITQVCVTINAEPETVWRFLSEPDKLLAWMTFIPGMSAPAGSVFEPAPGGQLFIKFPGGAAAKGNIVALESLRKLVFTWGYEPDVANTGLSAGACRVEITLLAVADGTRVTLVHSGPMSERVAREHESGWRHYLSQLALHSARAATDEHLVGTLANYWGAWNERDDAARSALLFASCEPGMRARTTFACTDSLDDFNKHIANGLRQMPGAILAPDGEPRHIHGFVRAMWCVTMPDGRVMFRGENFFRFSPRRRIAEVVGFPC